MAKILITGHRGFIGSHAVRHFNQKHDITVYDYDSRVFPDIQGLDWVIHFGGISSTNERDVERVLDQNLDFSVRLLDNCQTEGVNLQYASSASVYGETDHFRESGPVDPRSAYAWSKYLFERHVREHHRSPIRVQGFRYFNVYGTGEDHKPQPSPHSLFRKQKEIVLFVGENGKTASRDFVPVERILEIQEKFLSIPESGVWNIGTGKPKTFRDVAELIQKETGANIIERSLPPDLERRYQWYTCADLTHLESTLKRYGAHSTT